MEVKERALIYSNTISCQQRKYLRRLGQHEKWHLTVWRETILIDENDAEMSKEKRRRDSRALIGAEDRSLIGSNTRISQYTQSENALKQRLKDIDQSHQQSNRRISHETRELRQILHGLQKDLKVSRHYVPTQLEERQLQPVRTRRNTTSSFPGPPERLELLHKVLDDSSESEVGLPVDMPSNAYLAKRRRSNSMPSMKAARDLRNIQEEDANPAQATEERDKTEEEETIVRLQNPTRGAADDKTRRPAVHDSGSGNRVYPKRISAERLQQDARKRSTASAGQAAFSNAFLGRFLTSDESSAGAQVATPHPARVRRSTVAHRTAEMPGAPRKRLSAHELGPGSSSAFQPTLRKASLSYPLWGGGPANSPSRTSNPAAPPSSPRPPPASPLSEMESSAARRRLSVANRARSRRKASTLPPLVEDPAASKAAEDKVWTELARCRYLRRDESELTIEDIFRKDWRLLQGSCGRERLGHGTDALGRARGLAKPPHAEKVQVESAPMWRLAVTEALQILHLGNTRFSNESVAVGALFCILYSGLKKV